MINFIEIGRNILNNIEKEIPSRDDIERILGNPDYKFKPVSAFPYYTRYDYDDLCFAFTSANYCDYYQLFFHSNGKFNFKGNEVDLFGINTYSSVDYILFKLNRIFSDISIRSDPGYGNSVFIGTRQFSVRIVGNDQFPNEYRTRVDSIYSWFDEDLRPSDVVKSIDEWILMQKIP